MISLNWCIIHKDSEEDLSHLFLSGNLLNEITFSICLASPGVQLGLCGVSS